MHFSPRDKVILITGASSGIGRELALICARNGAKVALAARTEEKLREIEKKILEMKRETLVSVADITQAGDIRNMVEATLGKWGRIDVLVNNAGFGAWGRMEDLSMDLIRKNFETNCFSAVACAQAVIPSMRKSGGGLIVNVESLVALRSFPFISCYSATKHALHAFSEGLRLELARDHIRVLSICPGLIETEFHEKRVAVGEPARRSPRWLYMPAHRCAEHILSAMENGRSRMVITGHAKLIAFLQRLSPRLLDFILGRNLHRM